jgi:SAM-dependent methyltransferase
VGQSEQARQRRPTARRSPTVPAPGQTAADVIARRAEIWSQRPLTREVYRRYFHAMEAELAPGGRTMELGGGSGMAREFLPRVLVSDLVATPFVDLVASATRLPLRDGAADNLLMLDLLHHLPRPADLFREAVRALRPGGRLIMLEPFISPVSRLAFRLGHPERADMTVDPLPDDDCAVIEETGPFAANQAIPTLLFGRDRRRFHARFPDLRLRKRRLLSVFVYPMSGGFSGTCLVPRFAHRLAWGAEAVLLPLRRLLAFRMLVVLEKAGGARESEGP